MTPTHPPSEPLSTAPSSAPKPPRMYKDGADIKWTVEDHGDFEIHRRLTPVPSRRFTSAPPIMTKRIEKAR